MKRAWETPAIQYVTTSAYAASMLPIPKDNNSWWPEHGRLPKLPKCGKCKSPFIRSRVTPMLCPKVAHVHNTTNVQGNTFQGICKHRHSKPATAHKCSRTNYTRAPQQGRSQSEQANQALEPYAELATPHHAHRLNPITCLLV